MADKYAHLRQGAGDRSHYKSNGTPKIGMDRAQAEGAALSLRERGERCHAYPCPVCDLWHVGRLKKDENAQATSER